MADVHDFIRDLVTQERVVLFMKGNKFFPQCGFSNRAVQLLKATGVDLTTPEPVEKTFAVLADYVDRLESLIAQR